MSRKTVLSLFVAVQTGHSVNKQTITLIVNTLCFTQITNTRKFLLIYLFIYLRIKEIINSVNIQFTTAHSQASQRSACVWPPTYD